MSKGRRFTFPNLGALPQNVLCNINRHASNPISITNQNISRQNPQPGYIYRDAVINHCEVRVTRHTPSSP